jgi:hypothetical protein
MKMKFRCANNHPQEWHFEEQCSEWPLSEFMDTADVPPTSQLCSKCVDIKARELLADLIGQRGSPPVIQ